jgi:hypothetical protein
LFGEIPESTIVKSRVLLNIERFEIGQSYVTAKVQNRYGDKVTINLQGGRPGIELQESLFKIEDQDGGGSPRYAYQLISKDVVFPTHI